MSDASAPSRPTWPVIRSVLLDVAPSLLAYYGLRALGTSEYVALLSATLLAGAKVVFDAVRARRLDPFAGYLMLNFGLSLAVGLATSDARLLMAGNALVGGLGALVFLASCVVGKPLTQVITDRIKAGADADAPPVPGLHAFEHRVQVGLSAMWGVGLLMGMFISLALIFTLPVDVAKGLDTVVSLVLIAVLITAGVVVGKRAGARWEQRSTSPG